MTLVSGLLASLYLLIAVFCLAMTRTERLRTGEQSALFGGLGYLACLFWPVTFVVVALMARNPHARAPQAPASRRVAPGRTTPI